MMAAAELPAPEPMAAAAECVVPAAVMATAEMAMAPAADMTTAVTSTAVTSASVTSAPASTGVNGADTGENDDQGECDGHDPLHCGS